METEIIIDDVVVNYDNKTLCIGFESGYNFTKSEAIQLRNFLNQLNLGEEK